jgi:hypothetical protein
LNTLSQFADIRIKQAQHNNLVAQNDQIIQQTELTKAVRAAKEINTKFEKERHYDWQISAFDRKVLREQEIEMGRLGISLRKVEEQTRKYALKVTRDMNPAQVRLLNAKIDALISSTEWRQNLIDAQHDFVDPTADLTTRMIQASVQELLRNMKLPVGFDLENVLQWNPLNYLNPFR